MWAIIAGIICIAISIYTYIPSLKKAETSKGKWSVFFDFVFDPFAGLSTLFYLGLLFILYGILSSLNIL
ncbi:MAG TPA: hypothetical protein VNR38_08495 [Ureibacillus sp.]|nr:hypothetical protein [Ureibacillus sp.]